jgi:hypothetical protein
MLESSQVMLLVALMLFRPAGIGSVARRATLGSLRSACSRLSAPTRDARNKLRPRDWVVELGDRTRAALVQLVRPAAARSDEQLISAEVVRPPTAPRRSALLTHTRAIRALRSRHDISFAMAVGKTLSTWFPPDRSVRPLGMKRLLPRGIGWCVGTTSPIPSQGDWNAPVVGPARCAVVLVSHCDGPVVLGGFGEMLAAP